MNDLNSSLTALNATVARLEGGLDHVEGTRKVAGSIPAGTTRISAGHRISGIRLPIPCHSGTRLSAVYPPSRSSSEPVERIRHTIQVGIVEIHLPLSLESAPTIAEAAVAHPIPVAEVGRS